MYIYIYVHTLIHVQIHVHQLIHVRIYIYIHIYVYTYIYIYIHTYIHTYVHISQFKKNFCIQIEVSPKFVHKYETPHLYSILAVGAQLPVNEQHLY